MEDTTGVRKKAKKDQARWQVNHMHNSSLFREMPADHYAARQPEASRSNDSCERERDVRTHGKCHHSKGRMGCAPR